MKKIFTYENVTVELIDTSSNTERMKKLERPLKDFFRAVERERDEKTLKERDPNRARATSSDQYDLSM